MLEVIYEDVDGRVKATLVARMRDGDLGLSRAFGKDKAEALATLMICESIHFAKASRRMDFLKGLQATKEGGE